MLFDQDGKRFFKGNLHTHTTLSDGQKTPQDATSLYREKGYDFLALTDHWVLSDTVENPDFLLLSGIEYNTGNTVQEGIYHIVCIGASTPPNVKNENIPPQQIIDEINKADGIAILAHPAWSLDKAEEIAKLNDLCGAEIYNTVSAPPWNCRPYSGLIMDDVASRGRLLPCMAADDSHWYQGEQTRSFLLVEAKSLSRGNIIAAIKAGKFYATQGPMFSVSINEFGFEVTCQPGESGSPICEVVFFSDTVFASDRVTFGDNVKRAFYSIKPTDTFVRIEVIDKEGNVGWSSYYPVNK